MSRKIILYIAIIALYILGLLSGITIKSYDKNNVSGDQIISGDTITSGDTLLYTTDSVNVRVAPNTDAAIKTILSKNSVVIKVEPNESLWQTIRISGDSASGEYYIYKNFLSNTPIVEQTNENIIESGELIQEQEQEAIAETKTVSAIVTSKKENTDNNNFLGYFTITYYCPCTKCCGKYANGITASGALAKANHTIAASAQYKFGTKMKINNTVYTVEDRGGAIKGNKIDIYVDSHEEALKLGKQTKVPVYKVQ